MAAASPSGSATNAAPAAISTEPVSSGRTPKCFSVKSGVQRVSVKNSTSETCRKNAADSYSKTATIPSVVRIVTALHRKRAAPMSRSFLCRCVSRGCSRAARGLSAGTVPARASGSATLRELVHDFLVFRRIQWNIADLGHQARRLLEIIARERGDLRPLQRRAVDVDEERPRQRRVLPALHRLCRRLHAAGAVVHADCLQLPLVLLEVGEAEVAERVAIAAHTLYQHVVIFAGRVVAAARARLTDHRLREV